MVDEGYVDIGVGIGTCPFCTRETEGSKQRRQKWRGGEEAEAARPEFSFVCLA
jgi:hypothetical protein